MWPLGCVTIQAATLVQQAQRSSVYSRLNQLEAFPPVFRQGRRRGSRFHLWHSSLKDLHCQPSVLPGLHPHMSGPGQLFFFIPVGSFFSARFGRAGSFWTRFGTHRLVSTHKCAGLFLYTRRGFLVCAMPDPFRGREGFFSTLWGVSFPLVSYVRRVLFAPTKGSFLTRIYKEMK